MPTSEVMAGTYRPVPSYYRRTALRRLPFAPERLVAELSRLLDLACDDPELLAEEIDWLRVRILDIEVTRSLLHKDRSISVLVRLGGDSPVGALSRWVEQRLPMAGWEFDCVSVGWEFDCARFRVGGAQT